MGTQKYFSQTERDALPFGLVDVLFFCLVFGNTSIAENG